jgi:hypothetical protein
MTIEAIHTRTTSVTNMGNVTRSSDIASSNPLVLFADGTDRMDRMNRMNRRATMSLEPTQHVQPTSLVGDVIGGVAGGIGSLVMGVVDAIRDGLGALARGDILGAVANIPRAVINTGLGGFGLFTDVALGLFTTVVDGVLGLSRR